MYKRSIMRQAVAILLTIFVCSSANILYAQQNHTFKGIVLDSITGQAKDGVSIFNADTKKVIGFTNSNGGFTVSLPDNSVITFKMIGYIQHYIKLVNPGKEIRVLLRASSNADLKDVVVEGFRTISRQTNTGSSVIISGKDLQDNPSASVEALLQGRVAGLNIQNNNGSPGARSSILLRGLSSVSVSGSGDNTFLNPTSPLFVVDGVPVDMNSNYQYGFDQGGPGISPLALIPVEDIEKVEVLKDAAATALWGSRGAYGVILITTKRGNSEIPIVQYTGQFFYSTVPKLRDVIGGRGERMLRINEILGNDTSYAHGLGNINLNPILSDSLNPYYNNSTNWQSVFYKPTSNYTHNINIMGGSQKFNYKTNINIYKENGIIKNTGLTRYSLNMNALYQPSRAFRLMASINSGLAQNQKGSGIGLLQDGVAAASSASSLLPPPSNFSANNAALAGLAVKDDNKTLQIQPNIDIQWQPIQGLNFQSTTNYNFNSTTSDNFRPSFINSGNGLYTSNNSRTYALYNRNSINFIKSIEKSGVGVHNFNAFVFNEVQINSFRSYQAQAVGTPNDYIQGPTGYNWYGSTSGTYDNLSETRNIAFGGAFSYNYKLKYVLDFQYRVDGNSTNGPVAGYKTSPTFSARWNMQNEDWAKDWTWMNESSFRGSYGKILSPTGSLFTTFGKYVPGNNYNGQQSVGSDYSYIPNVNYQQFTNTELDFGYEGAFFNNRINFTYDFYYYMKDNQPRDLSLPNTSGFSMITTNGVSTVSYGNEFSLSYRAFDTQRGDKFTLTISANAALNRDVLTQLPGGVRQIFINDASTQNLPVLLRIGNNPLSTLVYNTVGVYPTSAAVKVDPVTGKPIQVGYGSGIFLTGGSPQWTDLNGDYTIDQNDLMILGNPEPKVTGGFNIYSSYKQWSATLSGSFTLFRDVINASLASRFQNFGNPYSDPTSAGVLVPLDQYNYWKQSGDIARYPDPNNFVYNGYINPYRFNQSLFMEDGSYWKFNSLTIAYTANRKWSQQFGVSSARLYLTAGNLLILSPYSGPNPENVSDLGRDSPNGYPNKRTFTLGVNLQF